MRAALVVVLTPCRDQNTGFSQARKPMVVEALIPEASIEAFYEGVLGRFAGLNHLELDAMLVSPLIERLAREFWALVCADRPGVAPESGSLVKHPGDIHARNPKVCNQIDCFLAEIINDGQHLDPPTIG